MLTRGADQEVGIAPRRRIEPLLDRLFVDLLEALRPLEDLLREQPCRPGDLGARGIRDAQVQDEARAVARLPLHPLHGGPGTGPEPRAVTQHVDPDALLSQLLYLARD